MATSYTYDNDSPLAITSSIAGILTFLAAVVLGVWFRINNWQAAEREFEDFERYLNRHRTELGWMHDLLYTQNEKRFEPEEDSGPPTPQPSGNDTVRLLEDRNMTEARIKAAVIKAEKNLLKSHRQHKQPAKYTTPRHRWFYIGSRVIQRNRLRKEALEKLAQRNARDRAMYHMILDKLAELDQALQGIVDRVRPPKNTTSRNKFKKWKLVGKVMEFEVVLWAVMLVALIVKLWQSWRSRYRVAWKWLSVREQAWKLRSERDLQWNRVHASQLALISRRLEDQEIQLTRLEGRFTGFLGLKTHEA